MSNAADQAAKEALQKAIADYYAAVEPGVYVEGWVLVTHKFSMELESTNQTAVGTLSATGQSFVVTVGLLDTALHGERPTL